ncbi:hypothetical protein JHK85_010934 [Glycine max]|nr:hypothetical protein JHK85_010934 [Glycine max]
MDHYELQVIRPAGDLGPLYPFIVGVYVELMKAQILNYMVLSSQESSTVALISIVGEPRRINTIEIYTNKS